MIDRNLARGIFVVLLALLFGVPAVLHYPIGNFARGGPGLFPTMVSGILGVIGLSMIIRSRFTRPERLEINLKNIGIIIASLVVFLREIFLAVRRFTRHDYDVHEDDHES